MIAGTAMAMARLHNSPPRWYTASFVRMSRPEGDITLTAAERPAEPALPVPELAIGTTIGRYLVERRLGAGGMGVVYAARDTELARDVALKIVRPRAEVGVMQERLRREAKAMARLSHPNVV